MKINTYSNIFDRLSAVLHTPQNVIAYEQIVDDTQIRLVTKALESLCLIYLKLAVIRFRKSNWYAD